MGDIEIFVDDAAGGNVGTGEKFIGPGAQNLAQRPIEPVNRPAFGKVRGNQRINFIAARVNAFDNIVEEIDFGIGIGRIFNRRAQPVLVEFVEQRRERRCFHFLWVERLHSSKAGGGTGTAHLVNLS